MAENILPAALSDMLRRNRLPHALLIEGEEGAPVKEAALAVAAAALCRQNDGSSCGKCPACRKVLDLCHSDVIIIDSEADKNSFRKDNIRAIRADAYRKPVEGRIKVYIFIRAERLDSEVQSLLLKITEEPPEDTCFILCCHNRYRLLPTVLSRVTGVQLPPLSAEQRAQWRGADPARKKLWEDAEAAAQALSAGDSYRFLLAAAGYEKKREDYARFLSALLELCREPGLHSDLLAAARHCDSNGHLPLVSSLLAARRG